jgi:hypothetical protein
MLVGCGWLLVVGFWSLWLLGEDPGCCFFVLTNPLINNASSQTHQTKQGMTPEEIDEYIARQEEEAALKAAAAVAELERIAAGEEEADGSDGEAEAAAEAGKA